MKSRVALVTTYNPGAAGPRAVGGHLLAHGHDVKLFHVKEFRAVAVPTMDFDENERLQPKRRDVEFFSIQHPAEILYLPYPSLITPREIDLFIEELRLYDPHIAGLSMFTVTVNVARQMTRIIHTRLPGLPVIWGGIHCMVHPEDCLRGLHPSALVNPARDSHSAAPAADPNLDPAAWTSRPATRSASPDCASSAPPPPAPSDDPLQVPDILCTTEGEIPMLRLMERWDDYLRGEIPAIPGLWFVRRDGRGSGGGDVLNGAFGGNGNGNGAHPPSISGAFSGANAASIGAPGACGGTGVEEVVRFEREPFPKDLDVYAWPLYAHKEVLIDDNTLDYKFEDKRGPIINHILLMTERGCPYSCSFCIHSVINKMDKNYQRVRRRSVDDVINEVEKRVRDHGVKHFMIHDEIFAIQKDWVMEFARKWEQRLKPEGVTVNGYVHPITTDFEMLEALFNAGLSRTGVGLQTGSYRIAREIYDRPMHRDRILQMMEWISRFPFEQVQVDVIVDNPFETEDDRRATLDLLTDMKGTFHVETLPLMFYSTTQIIHKKGEKRQIHWRDSLFWVMLYHLTGTNFLSKQTIMGLSYDTYLRQNPYLLEKLVLDVNGWYFMKNKGFLRPFHEGAKEEELLPSERAVLAQREHTQAYNASPLDLSLTSKCQG